MHPARPEPEGPRPSRRRASRAALLVLVAATACPTACRQGSGSLLDSFDAVVHGYDVDRQRETGMAFDRDLQRSVTVIHDPVVAGYVNELGQHIAQQIEPQPFVYRFRVIDDPTLNAFAVPGGYLYFHSGTLLGVASVDELAGVIAHEIAHVKARHHFRMQQRSQLPDLLVGAAGLAAAAATGEPGLATASQAVNVTLKLRYSREFETEADQLGGVFTARAGYDAAAISHFFHRLLEEERGHPDRLPPYLYSHPEVESRIAAVELEAQNLSPARGADPALAEALPAMQARLRRLIDSGRATLPADLPPPDRSRSDPLLALAAKSAEAGDVEGALGWLARAEALEPADPRVPYRRGELLSDQGRHAEAVEAYRRVVALDPSRARVHFQLGQACKAAGERHLSVYSFEQAILRSGEGSSLREQAEWEVAKLTFDVIASSGFADGGRAVGEGNPLGHELGAVPAGAPRVAWWARLGPRFVPHADRLRVRWSDPSGRPVQETPATRYRRSFVGSTLELAHAGTRAGEWSVEVRFDDDLIERRTLTIQ